MKHILLGAAMMCSIAKAGVPTDKVAHAGLSFAMSSVIYTSCRMHFKQKKAYCIALAGIGSMFIGTLKEAYDGKQNSYNEHLKDIGANAVGSALALTFFGLTF